MDKLETNPVVQFGLCVDILTVVPLHCCDVLLQTGSWLVALTRFSTDYRFSIPPKREIDIAIRN